MCCVGHSHFESFAFSFFPVHWYFLLGGGYLTTKLQAYTSPYVQGLLKTGWQHLTLCEDIHMSLPTSWAELAR
jgi:hypothetical protein